jgi:hypothetical protein
MSGAVSPFFLCSQGVLRDILSLLFTKKCYTTKIDSRYTEGCTTAVVSMYVPYYHTAHVTGGCTNAERLVARSTKLHRWRLDLQNNYCSLLLTHKEVCQPTHAQQDV